MKGLDNKVEQILYDFDALQNIEPSDAWQQSVINRLATVRPDAPLSLSTKTLMVVGLLFVGLNIGFIFKKTSAPFETAPTLETFNNDTAPTLENEREATFKTISKEFFINPTSIKN